MGESWKWFPLGKKACNALTRSSRNTNRREAAPMPRGNGSRRQMSYRDWESGANASTGTYVYT